MGWMANRDAQQTQGPTDNTVDGTGLSRNYTPVGGAPNTGHLE